MSIHASLKNIKKNNTNIKLDFDINKSENIYVCEMLFNYMKTRENGKRYWIENSDGSIDYGSSTKSNYPEWIKFYFNKTPKNLRDSYKDWGELGLKGKKPWEASFFNGNRRELLYTLKNASEGKAPKSDRMITVLNEAFNGFLNDLENLNIQIFENSTEFNLEEINLIFNLAQEEDELNIQKITEEHMIEF